MLTFRFTGVDGEMIQEETLTVGMVGRQVMLEFSEEWEGVSKTVVFSAGSVTRDVVYTGGPVTIPAEVLEIPLALLWVGVYGVSADGTVVVPTAQVAGPVIMPSLDPSGDPGTDPDLPIWAQLQTQLDQSGEEITELSNYISNISNMGRYVSDKGYVLSIDTNAMTVQIPDGFVFYKRPKMDPVRMPVTDTICAINTESVFSFVVIDVTNKQVSSIKPDNFNANRQVVLAVLWRNHYTDPAANWILGPYKVNHFLYNAPVEQAVYVATTGNDSDIGDRNSPFRTINKAVASGAKTIFVFPGTYRESISASRTGGEIEILAKPSSKTEKDVVLDFGTEIAMAEDSETGLVKAAFVSTSDDFIYRAFVSKTETLIYDDGFTADGYACNLWHGDTKLIPVLTLAECQATSGTWFYDGANVYANAEAGTFTLADGAVDYGINLSYFKKVKLVGIDVRHARMDGVKLEGCTDAEISRCRFSHSGLYNGLALNNTSATVRDCEAMYNRTDGFNIHGVGTVDFIDCMSHDNWDDGISHHDASDGIVIGGEYYNNGKGGICSPTFGSRNSINGAYIHDNTNGVYAVTDQDGTYPQCTVSNCTIVNNANGIRTSRYELLGWNNTVSGNGRDVVEENGGSWTVMGGNSIGYTLPVATPNRLGGVKPAEKSEDMTQSVGVDENGGLWTAPGGGTGDGERWEELLNVTAEEEITHIHKDLDVAGKFKKLSIFTSLVGVSTNTTGQHGIYLIANNKGQWMYNDTSTIFSVSNAHNTDNKEYAWLIDISQTHATCLRDGAITTSKAVTCETVINSLTFATQNWTYKFGVGTIIKIYGVRA